MIEQLEINGIDLLFMYCYSTFHLRMMIHYKRWKVSENIVIMMPSIVEANQPEILRAAQKDESYINMLRSELADIIQRLFGKTQLN